ncbi:Phosphoribosylformylglycinamidine synthase [Manis javanica]|nr:Phosphoribosylformylglycinamidine synthase [Manis javanica]
MAVAEAITNMLAAPIELSKVKLSANWMGLRRAWRRRGALRHRQGRGHGAVPAAGHLYPRGQGQPVHAHPVERGGQVKKVTSPVSLIITGFASIDDVRGTLTPQLDASKTTAPWSWWTWAAARCAWAAPSWARCWASPAMKRLTSMTPRT